MTMGEDFGKFDPEQAKNLLRSPAGQQLLALLRQQDGQTLQQAAQAARTGNFAQAKELLSGFADDPQAAALLKKLSEGR